jgi:hydroxyacylglutathione hydrolase
MPDNLRVHSLTLGPLGANCFLAVQGRDALVIDPGDEPMEVVRLVARLSVTPVAILLTHGHFDHFGATQPLVSSWQVPVYVGAGDAARIAQPGTAWGISVPPVTADPVLLEGEQTLALPLPVLALPTPGHSPGSYTFQAGEHLFSGDLIFAGSVGRTDLPGGSSQTLIESIASLLRRFPAETIVHCGHGPDTTLGRELARNPFFAPLRRELERS